MAHRWFVVALVWCFSLSAVAGNASAIHPSIQRTYRILPRFSVLNQVKYCGNVRVLKLQHMNAYLVAVNSILKFPHVYLL